MDESELLELRDLIKRYFIQNSCVKCGACCLNFRTFFTKLEYERIVAKYGAEKFQLDAYGFPIMTMTERDLFCPFLANSAGAMQNVLNYYRTAVKCNGDFHDHIENCECSIYDERPIVCRIYPTYPFSNRCTVGMTFQAEIKDLRRYQLLLYKYTLAYRNDMLDPQPIDWDRYRPVKNIGLVQIDEREITHWTKIFGYFQPFWSIWTFALALQLDTEQQAVLKHCTGAQTVPEIVAELGVDRAETIEFLKSLIAHGLIEPPAEIKYPKLNNLFYPTLSPE